MQIWINPSYPALYSHISRQVLPLASPIHWPTKYFIRNTALLHFTFFQLQSSSYDIPYFPLSSSQSSCFDINNISQEYIRVISTILFVWSNSQNRASHDIVTRGVHRRKSVPDQKRLSRSPLSRESATLKASAIMENTGRWCILIR